MPLQEPVHTAQNRPLLTVKWVGTPGSKEFESNVLYPLASGEECMSRNDSDITGSSAHIPSVHQEEVTCGMLSNGL